MKIKRSKKAIKKLLKIANEHEGIFAGDTYENGIIFGIEWLLHKKEINPMKGYKAILNKDK